MTKLTAKDRAALEPSQFGLPDKARTKQARKLLKKGWAADD
jgi:hypothetical protein